MRKALLLSGVVMLATASATSFAAGNPWDGTWKLNKAKSKLTGSTFTVTKAGNMYTMDDGAVRFKFACDGKDYPVIGDYTTTCSESGQKATTTSKLKGKQTSTTTHEISADGKTMTESTKGSRPDGTSYTSQSSYVRVAGSGTGLAGTWRNTKVDTSAPDVMIMKVNGDVLHFENPSYKSSGDAKLDGTPAPLKGPTVPTGLMLSNKTDGPNKVVTVVTLNGKDLSKDIMTISADGKSISDVSWTPGKESEKQTFVYEKQ